MQARLSKGDIELGPAVYSLWVVLSVVFSIAVAGLSPENTTRLLVITFLLAQILFRSVLVSSLRWLAPRSRFIVFGVLLASAVEGLHMNSAPVFKSLRMAPGASPSQWLNHYLVDLLFTVPAYLVIFLVIWSFMSRLQFTPWQYVIIMGLGQTLGDGGLAFFLASPAMLVFLPYPMTNYHAINILPYLSVQHDLKASRPATGWHGLLAVTGLTVTYFLCGSLIRVVGRLFGLE